MSWRAKLELLEQRGDAKGAVLLLESIDVEDSEFYLRVLFLLLDWMVEGLFSVSEQTYGWEKIQEIYSVVQKKEVEDSEFLFFCGIMIYRCEWCFGLDSVDSATLMLEKAMLREPNNTLFQWGYISEVDQRIDSNTQLKTELTKQILFKEPQTIKWLKGKGLLGEYVLGLLEGLLDALKNMK